MPYYDIYSFVRYQKLEEQRFEKEHAFRVKQINMEKEMRKEEREHELNMLRLLVTQQPSSVPLPSSSPCNMPVSGFLPSSSQVPECLKVFIIMALQTMLFIQLMRPQHTLNYK